MLPCCRRLKGCQANLGAAGSFRRARRSSSETWFMRITQRRCWPRSSLVKRSVAEERFRCRCSTRAHSRFLLVMHSVACLRCRLLALPTCLPPSVAGRARTRTRTYGPRWVCLRVAPRKFAPIDCSNRLERTLRRCAVCRSWRSALMASLSPTRHAGSMPFALHGN